MKGQEMKIVMFVFIGKAFMWFMSERILKALTVRFISAVFFACAASS